ncbi:beta-ketoacyl synthase N-terminal-like domain-containing protein [Thermodesulfobacteriota bacterium]
MNIDEFNELDSRNGIAIVGMSGRFPGAENIEQFWQNLVKGVCSIETYTDDDCRASGVPETYLNNPKYVKRGASLKRPDLFDATFFGYSPVEAQSIDPQHRIFLEGAWEALENSGYNPDTFDGDIGVYAGCGMNYYLLKNLMSTETLMESVITAMNFFGNDKDYLSTRISYKMNLTGASVNIQSACSTSLVAVQLACQGLSTYQCDMALAGGVSLQAPRMKGYLYAEGEIFSKDGYCRTFDRDATGTVFGEGYGIVVLKRIEDAIEDRDTIYAVIQGIATNNDGSDKVGFTAPSVSGQKAVIAMAQALADVNPEEISYIEAHGTGTQMGDPMELSALSQVFREHTDKKNYCAIGSVKPNVGHMDVAAGVVGLIKLALSLKNRQIPPSILFKKENPELKLVNSPFYVNTELSEWRANGRRLRWGGVSSFGIGGTNAHAVISEAPHMDTEIKYNPFILFNLSAKSPTALNMLTKNMVDHLEANPNLNLADASFTLQVGRRHFKYRRILVFNDRVEALRLLKSDNPLDLIDGTAADIEKKVVFMFTGQGSQYVNMAADLYRDLNSFKEIIDQGADILEPIIQMDIRSVIFSKYEDEARSFETLCQTAITQPALFLIEYALAQIFMNWGIKPWAMVGHSIGEYVAACLAGVFSFEDALRVVAERGRLMQAQKPGGMLAIMISEEKLLPLVEAEAELSVAAVNSPRQCVVSGPDDAIDNFQKVLSGFSKKENSTIRFQKLKTSHAFHSDMMEPAVEPFKKLLGTLILNPPKIKFISNSSGTWIESNQATDPAYWAMHIRKGVRFSDGIRCLVDTSDAIMLEIGPGTTLTALAGYYADQKKNTLIIPSIRRADQKESDYKFLLKTLGKIWANGVHVDWKTYHADARRMRIPLPTYPFERKRFWIEGKIEHEVGTKYKDKNIRIGNETEKLEDNVISPHHPKLFQSQQSDVEKTLKRIWQKVLGYQDIKVNENYFELGGNSLMAVSLFDKIEHTYRIRLPLSTLYEAPTIKQLAEIIKDEEYEPSWDSLVAINTDGTKPPLFFVHAEGGNVLEYRPLSTKIGRNQPFYALQAEGLKGEEIITHSIEEMAANYLQEIKTVQPKGPYYIGGYCLGGLVSFEMAHQLIHNGEEVAELFLISTSTPDQLRNTKQGMKGIKRIFNKIIERVELELDNWSNLPSYARRFYAFDRINRFILRSQIRIEGKLDELFSLFGRQYKWHSRAYVLQTSVDHSNEAFGSYQPIKYPGAFHLFRVSHPQWERQLNIEPLLGWQGLTEKPIKLYKVDGFHRNILKPPYAYALADKIKDILENSRQNE